MPDLCVYSVLHFYEKSFLANFAIPMLLRTLDIHAFYILSRVRIIAIGFKVRFEFQNCSKVKVKKYRPWCPGASITLSGIEMLLAFAEGDSGSEIPDHRLIIGKRVLLFPGGKLCKS